MASNPERHASQVHIELRVFDALAGSAGLTAPELVDDAGIPAEELPAVLAALEDRGVVRVDTGGVAPRWHAREPPDPVASELGRLEQELIRIQTLNHTSQRMRESYWRRRQNVSYDALEVLRDRDEIVETVIGLQRRAEHQIRGFDRPPYYTDQDADDVREQADTQLERMAAGVQYRVVYEPEVWNRPVHADYTMASLTRGEQARQLPSLPMKLFLIDDQRAVMPLDPRHHEDGATLVVHPSGLLNALIEIFEFYWQAAVPITPTGSTPTTRISHRERQVLTLLAAGAQDDQIARQLGLSRSTVTRTIQALGVLLGATTRFQFGSQAVRLGLL